MNWSLQCSEGSRLPLPPGVDIAVGAGGNCGLRLRGPGIPEKLGRLSATDDEVWLHVDGGDPPIAVNGRPVRALSRLVAGDRICFGASCVDLLGQAGKEASSDRPTFDRFALRARGGAGSGRIQHGPAVHLDADGEVVPAAVAVVAVELLDGLLRLTASTGGVKVNGHAVNGEVELGDNDQVQIGPRRYQLEAESTRLPDAVTQRLPAMSVLDEDAEPGPIFRGDMGALWWLIGIAGVIAALVSALLYFHR